MCSWQRTAQQRLGAKDLDEEANPAGGDGLSAVMAKDEELYLPAGGDKVFTQGLGSLNPHAGHHGKELFPQLNK